MILALLSASVIAVAAGWRAGVVNDPLAPVLALIALSAVSHGALWLASLRRRVSQLDPVPGALDDVGAQVDKLAERLDALELQVAALPDSQAIAAEMNVLHGLLKDLRDRAPAPSLPAPPTGAADPTPPGGETVADPMAAITDDAPPSTAARDLAASNALDDGEVLEAIEGALRADKVELFLQPVVTLPQRKHVFYECLSRIPLGDGALLVPQRYLQLATERGLVSAIDNLLLFRLVQLVRAAQRDHLDIGFFCNISDATMRDVAFFQDFVGFLAANPSLKNSLIFEFSQAVIDSDDLETRINLQRLTQLGFRLSLDRVSHFDFDGADLAAQRFGFIKVNAHMLHEYADHNSVANLRGNLSRHGIDLIVEKIESEDMLADLRQLGITYGQGFLFGEPRAARIQNDR